MSMVSWFHKFRGVNSFVAWFDGFIGFAVSVVSSFHSFCGVNGFKVS